MSPALKFAKRWITIAVGIVVTVVGLILMPMPGPGGTPTTLAGLAILAAEVPWARGILLRLKDFLLAPRPWWMRVGIIAGLIVFWVGGSILAWRMWPPAALRTDR